MELSGGEGSVEIFCSYSRHDEPLRQEFQTSVAPMRRNNWIDVWHDRRIEAGEEWADKIDEHLDTADIVALFVSRDFLASDYCYKELGRALERASRQEVVIIPILVRDCDWSDAPFSRFQGIPAGKAVTSWPNRDEAWTAVTKGLKETVLKVLKSKQAKVRPPNMAGALGPFPAILPGLRRDFLDQPGNITDQAKARAILEQVANSAARQKEDWRMNDVMQARIFELTQDLTQQKDLKRRTADKSFNNMDAYIRE